MHAISTDVILVNDSQVVFGILDINDLLPFT
jgi:hypothetical protein